MAQSDLELMILCGLFVTEPCGIAVTGPLQQPLFELTSTLELNNQMRI